MKKVQKYFVERAEDDATIIHVAYRLKSDNVSPLYKAIMDSLPLETLVFCPYRIVLKVPKIYEWGVVVLAVVQLLKVRFETEFEDWENIGTRKLGEGQGELTSPSPTSHSA